MKRKQAEKPNLASDPVAKSFMQLPRLERGRLLFLGVVTGLFLIGSVLAGYAFYYQDRFLPRAQIGGVAVGGLTREQALEQIQEKAAIFRESILTLNHNEKSWEIRPVELETDLAVDQAVAEAWQRDKGGGWQYQLASLLRAPLQSRRTEVAVTAYSEKGGQLLTEKVLSEIETAYQEIGLDFKGPHVAIVPGKAGTRLDRNKFEQSLSHVFKEGTQQFSLVLVQVEPELTEEDVVAVRDQAETILSGSWTVTLTGAQAVQIPRTTLAEWLTTYVERDANERATGLILGAKSSLIAKAADEWAMQYDRKARNARLAVQGDQVVVTEAGIDGRLLNRSKTITALEQAVLRYHGGAAREAMAAVETVPPAVRADTLESLGLRQRLSSNTTDFAGSPANRKFNISLGQKNLDRTLLMPGETFSTVETLGPITEEAGFLAELVIKNNRTIPEAGGGLCQVSTTLFRAVLAAGMPIVERQNHSYRVSYYEREVGPGLDATIYSPKPDFRFRNDLASAIYIQSKIEGTKVTFELYGTSDGRVATIGTPAILEESSPGNPIYIETDTLYQGEQKQIETAHGGAKTSVTYTVSRNGEEIISQTFRSTYKPWPAQYLVGTKPR